MGSISYAVARAPISTAAFLDRKSTRLNSSHLGISYAVFCLKKKNGETRRRLSHRGELDLAYCGHATPIIVFAVVYVTLLSYVVFILVVFFFNGIPTAVVYILSLHDALPI